MRSLTLLTLLSLAVPTASFGEDLFSEIAVESVFGGAEAGASDGTATSLISGTSKARVTGAGQLGELLRSGGFKPERVDGKTVKTSVAHGRWTLPTTLFAAVERGQIDIRMGLATLKKGAKGDPNKLLRLLAASDDGGVHFAFDKSAEQIQVRQTLSARGLSSVQLKRTLTELAEFAVASESAWYAGADNGPSTTAATTATPGATSAVPTPKALVGSWIATLGAGEAFAIKLTPDDKFTLAHVKAGKTTTSAGKAELTGDQLRLAGDSGVTIAGVVSNATADGFGLTLTGGKKLAFKRPTK